MPIALPRIKYLIVSIALLLLIWAAGFSSFVHNITKPVAESSLTKTELIAVWTGGQSRINTGLELLSRAHADELLISGVNNTLSVADLIKIWKPTDAAITVPEEMLSCCIHLGRDATNTRENAIETKNWVNTHDVSSLTLVTAHYHMPRALLEFKNEMPHLTVVAYPVFPDQTKPYTANFWTLAFIEYHKTILTWLRIAVKL